jgi:uncharacterized membrane protein YfcA
MNHRQQQHIRLNYIYPLSVVIIFIGWIVYMEMTSQWHLFLSLWPCSLTMIGGAFVAGSTPGGGGAFAFPVFTKVLAISAADARTFAFMIQSVGMSMAAMLILTRSIRILPKVIIYASLGGVAGIVPGSLFLAIPSPIPKVIFSISIATLGVALFLSTYIRKSSPLTNFSKWRANERVVFLSAGFLGGLISSYTGCGIDMVVFIVLTLAYGINEKISIPTSVIIMALNSGAGFFIHGVVLQDIDKCWEYWLVSIPIVIICAPLGAWTVSRLNRHYSVIPLILLAGLELATTVWLIPLTPWLVDYMLLAALVCTVWFTVMLGYRQKQIMLYRQPYTLKVGRN